MSAGSCARQSPEHAPGFAYADDIKPKTLTTLPINLAHSILQFSPIFHRRHTSQDSCRRRLGNIRRASLLYAEIPRLLRSQMHSLGRFYTCMIGGKTADLKEPHDVQRSSARQFISNNLTGGSLLKLGSFCR